MNLSKKLAKEEILIQWECGSAVADREIKAVKA